MRAGKVAWIARQNQEKHLRFVSVVLKVPTIFTNTCDKTPTKSTKNSQTRQYLCREVAKKGRPCRERSDELTVATVDRILVSMCDLVTRRLMTHSWHVRR